MQEPIISTWDDARKYFMAEGEYTAVIVGKDVTDGAYVITNGIIAPGSHIPDHYHKNEDQTFHVVTGQIEARVGGRTTILGPGDSVFCPRGIAHYMRNVGDETAKLISYIIPGHWAEGFMAETSRQNSENDLDLALIEEKFGVVYV